MTFHGFKSEDAKNLGKIVSKAFQPAESYENLKKELINLLERVTPFWKSTPTVFNLLHRRSL